MNSKKLKHCYGPKKGLKTKTKDGEAEIFVLSPDLLQKLGINLGNVANTQECPTNLKSPTETVPLIKIPELSQTNDLPKANSSIIEQKEIKRDTTILETASLMKNSVLLSPTFINTGTAVNPGELEISTGDSREKCLTDIIEITDVIEKVTHIRPPNQAIIEEVSPLQYDNLNIILDQHNYISSNDKDMTNGVQSMNMNSSNSDYDLSSMQKNNEITLSNVSMTDILKKTTRVISTDEHPDEAYSSDCSNSNSGPSDTSQYIPEMNSFHFKTHNQGSNKINILCEEILNPLQIKELKNLHSAKLNDFISLPINSVIQPCSPNTNLQPCIITSNCFDIKVADNTQTDPHKSIESVILFDEEGNAINTTNDDLIVDAEDLDINKSNFPLLKQIEINSNTYQSPVTVQELIGENNKSDLQTPESSFGDGIDFAITDIEMHLKENEDTLENFVKEITSNDNNEILTKIEKNEEVCSTNPSDKLNALNTVTNNHLSVDLTESSVDDYDLIGKEDPENHMARRRKRSVSEITKNMIDDGENLTHTEFKSTVSCAVITREIERKIEENKIDINMESVISINNDMVKSIVNHDGQSQTIICNSSEHVTCNGNKNQVADIADKADDKVKEIAFFLRQFTKIRSNCRKIKLDISPALQPHSKRPKHNNLKPKLHIQGVEKPGGSENLDANYKTSKLFKTYSKVNRLCKLPRVSSLPFISESTNESENAQILSNDLTGDDCSTTLTQCTKRQDFCLCRDFGSLDYYDSEVVYQHIHFWENKNYNFDRDILFSIYYDNPYFDNIHVEDLDKDKKDDLEVSEHGICWNTIENTNTTDEDLHKEKYKLEVTNVKIVPDRNEAVIDSDFVKGDESSNVQSDIAESSTLKVKNTSVEQVIPVANNVEILTQKVSKETDGDDSDEQEPSLKQLKDAKQASAKCNPPSSDEPSPNTKQSSKKAKKRKKTLNKISNDKKDDGEPSRKKSIQCGVCNLVLTEEEWEDHASREHCFIAWKSGSTLNIDEPELYDKLKTILKDKKSLKCTFCNTEIKNGKKFLSHVRKCLRKEDSQNKTIIDQAEQTSDDVTKCGVCEEEISITEWIQHIANKHDYIAWKHNEPPLDLDDEDEVRKHLTKIIKEVGELICKCGLVRKYAKSFMVHIQKCKDNFNETFTEDVKCGVCDEIIKGSQWIQHLAKEHQYLAWKVGDPVLILDDEVMVRQHLQDIANEYGSLVCNKCGSIRKHAKSYLQHIEKCAEGSTSVDEPKNETADTSIKTNSAFVRCGVCEKEVPPEKWMRHMQKKHDYLAWKEGEESLDLNDDEQVYNHLYAICQKKGGLQCSKCGIVRKYVKLYVQHVKSCEVEAAAYDESENIDEKILTCAVCFEQIEPKDWVNHRMKKHYNLAWSVGEVPIDLKNCWVIDRYLKEYKNKYNKLVCKLCGTSRASSLGFYAHVIACGKSEEEIDGYKMICDICNKKYLCIYQNQHMTWHREQERANERKLKEVEVKEEKKKIKIEIEVEGLGRRKAAQNAQKVIEKYKQEVGQFSCPNCKFDAECKSELAKHVCVKEDMEVVSDSDESVKLEASSGEDDEDTDVESNISDEELEESTPRKRSNQYASASSKIPRFLYKPPNVNNYLLKSGKEFSQFHYTADRLFPEWHISEYEEVKEDNWPLYMPTMQESCQVKLGETSWTKFKLFDVHSEKGQNILMHSIFVGACIQSVTWAPPVPTDQDSYGHYLAVAIHRGPDSPRLSVEETPSHPGLIQIWDFNKFKLSPKFVLGIAHNYGVAWAMDWCPSGARDVIPESEKIDSFLRLGLLAVAFSNGFVYIFSVPYPSSIVENDKLLFKLKPVAELRLTSGPDRKKNQATSISWSTQRNHAFIIVGYAEGTTAYFDLNTDSPFLKNKENEVTIFYPYHDERPHNTCVTGVGVYPSVSSIESCGAVCSGSATGAALLTRAAARPARQASRAVCLDVRFEPLWPTVALAGDDAGTLTAPNELDVFGGGRRLAAAGALATCAVCARAVLAAPPLLRAVRPHPAVPDYKKHVVAILKMAPLSNKLSKLENDELQTKVEPITYEKAIKMYGIVLNVHKETVSKQSVKTREQFHERFPLADVTSMAFCPSTLHHGKLAVATHAGIIFLINV